VAEAAIVGFDSPPPVPFYGDHWERGVDPWHRDGFPDEFKDLAPSQSYPPGQGWLLIDWCGNVIGFVSDEQWARERHPA
jgi:hypothetical protein